MSNQQRGRTPLSERWHQRLSAQVGRSIAAARTAKGLSAQALSDRLGDLGHELGRATISQLEHGQRDVKLADVLAIAAALDVPPVTLVFDPEAQATVEAVPERRVATRQAVAWWRGSAALPSEGLGVPEWLAEEGRRLNAIGQPVRGRLSPLDRKLALEALEDLLKLTAHAKTEALGKLEVLRRAEAQQSLPGLARSKALGSRIDPNQAKQEADQSNQAYRAYQVELAQSVAWLRTAGVAIPPDLKTLCREYVGSTDEPQGEPNG
ncbi:MAG: helix-turn-helix domain-containing protein [Bifidobacteriaceae bacterium]|jgi:transcriptional regulator with XRE-family HTH domain|nr:helix-turn-helix domain-containing protein [Bifidobacteriaceae bacterium]